MFSRRWPAAVTAVAVFVFTATLLGGPAQQPPATSRLITLGTRSGPFPTGARAQSSNAVVVGSAVYVIDAGDGAVRRMAEAGLPIQNIEAVFLTHLHDDHTSGLVPLMATEYNLDRTRPVAIFGPPLTRRLVDAATEFLMVNSSIRVSEGTRARLIGGLFTAHETAPGPVYEDAHIRVRAAENSHFRFPGNGENSDKTRSYSYRVDAPDRSIVFSGDTGMSDALVELAKGATMLVIEASDVTELKAIRERDGSWARWTTTQQASWLRHMTDEHVSPEQVAAMAVRAGVSEVVITHLPQSERSNDGYERYAEVIRRTFKGRVRVAADLSVF